MSMIFKLLSDDVTKSCPGCHYSCTDSNDAEIEWYVSDFASLMSPFITNVVMKPCMWYQLSKNIELR